MGLDMYAYTTKQPIEAVDFSAPGDAQRMAYWRKHPDLHGWMRELYYAKDGQQESFNCATVQLDEADLDRLEVALNAGQLPSTTGFFFGASRPEEIAFDRAFIAEARKAITEGFFVFYDSWW